MSDRDVETLRAQVERELLALGFVRRAPNAARCAPAFRNAERFAKGEISVWPTYGPTPYRLGKVATIAATEGRAVVQLRIENMELYWGC